MKNRLLLVLVLLPTLARPVHAGIIFGKKTTPPSPTERVPELVTQLKTDGDENKRAKAAEELRQYDPKTFPEIVPLLVDVLINDKKPAVRAEAAQSLGKLRPISQQAGLALEHALAKDSSMRVRLQARSSLLQYHWAGYRSSKKDEATSLPQTKEPPLASPGSFPPPIQTTTVTPRLTPQPLPPPIQRTPVLPTSRPLPNGPAQPLPAGPAPLPKGPEQGPDLFPATSG
jgi:hypothetical protein